MSDPLEAKYILNLQFKFCPPPGAPRGGATFLTPSIDLILYTPSLYIYGIISRNFYKVISRNLVMIYKRNLHQSCAKKMRNFFEKIFN